MAIPAGAIDVGSQTMLLRYVPNEVVLDRLLQAARQEIGPVIDMFIRPITPMKTGALRESLRGTVTLEEQTVVMTFLAGGGEVDYAQFLELPWYARRIKNFTTPGTQAPFLVPGVETALPYLHEKFTAAIEQGA